MNCKTATSFTYYSTTDLFLERFEDSDFFLRLSMETLLIADDFERHVALRFVVERFNDLPKRSLS